MGQNIKVNVQAAFDKGSSDQALRQFEQQFNTLGKNIAGASKAKFNPIEKASIEDVNRLTKAFQNLVKIQGDLRKRMATTGQTGKGFFDVDWASLYPDQNSRGRQMQKAFEYVGGQRFEAGAPAGGGGSSGGRGGGSGGGSAPPAHAGATAARNILGSALNASGSTGQAANSALSAGMAGGLGAGIGVLAAAAIGKVVGAISNKVGAAQQEFIGYDTLKRTLGDVNVSFGVLRESLRENARSLDMTFEEGQRLGIQFAKLSGMTAEQYKTLGEEANVGGGFGRSFGMDPSQSNSFFAQMRLMQVTTNTQQSRELALLIAESISKSGAFSKADEVLEAVASFATTQTRNGMAVANVGGYASMLTGMIGSHMPGMDPSGAAALLSRMNSSVAGGGAAGEAGQNFIYSGIGGRLGLNPIQTAILREQGMFGTGRQAFGKGSAYAAYGGSPTGAAGSDTTNFQMLQEHFKKVYGDSASGKMLMADAMANFYGINHNQAMAMSAIKPATLGGLGARLQRLGIDGKDVNATGISSLAQIEGNSGLSEAEKDKQVREAAGKNQEDTEGSRTRATINGLDRIEQAIAGKTVPLLNDIRSGIMFLAGEHGGGSPRQIMESIARAESGDRAGQINSDYDNQSKKAREEAALAKKKHTDAWSDFQAHGSGMTKEQQLAARQKLADLMQQETDAQQRITKLQQERVEKLDEEKMDLARNIAALKIKTSDNTVNNADYQSGGAAGGRGIFNGRGISASLLAELAKTDKLIGAPEGFSASQIQQESGFNPNARSGKGAMGLAQVMPDTLAKLEKRFGRKLDPSNEDDAVLMHRELMTENTRRFGNYRDGARAYNGGWDPAKWGNKETRNYVPFIESRLGHEQGTPLPANELGNMAAREEFRRIEVSGTFNLNGANGMPAAAPVQVRTQVGAAMPSGVMR